MPVMFRLFRSFAGRYWFRLLLGIVAGLIMGGAMRASLSVLDFGVDTIQAGAAGSSGLVSVEKKDVPVPQGKSCESQEAAVSTEPKEVPPAAPLSPIAKKLQKFQKRLDAVGIHVKLSGEEEVSWKLLACIVGLAVLMVGLKSLGEFVNKYYLSWVGQHVVADIRSLLFDHFQRQSMSYFSQHDVGVLMSRCLNDAAGVDHAFSNCIAEFFLAPVQIFVAVEFLVEKALHLKLLMPVVVLIVLTPICMVPILIISKLLRKYQHRVLDRVSVLTARMQENLNGIREVKAFHREDAEKERFDQANRKYFKEVVRALLADIFMQPTMQIVSLGLGAVFLVVCHQNHITLATLAVLGYAASTAYRPLKELAKMNAALQRCAAAAQRIFDALDDVQRLPEPVNSEPVLSFEKEIVFDHVDFSYRPELPQVLSDFHLTMKKGQHVAIVGATGSGKSTVANLLARFYDPCRGSVRIDGHDLRNVSNDDLRKLVGIVSQDTFLFNGDIRSNIAFGRPDATDEEIADVARRANAEEFIQKEKDGYARQVGERGCMLSGGQKQRIAIARTLLTNPPILILDEATSALDTVTEQQVQQAIVELMKDRTVLSIAHRLSTIVSADLIVVLEDGQIVEQGSHAELYAKGGRYADLYNRQIAKK